MKLRCGETVRVLEEEPAEQGFALVTDGKKKGYVQKAYIWRFPLYFKVLQPDQNPLRAGRHTPTLPSE